MRAVLKGMYFSAATDAWTAYGLHNITLGIFKKTGPSKAIDFLAPCQSTLKTFDLHTKLCSAIVTDTEAAMCNADHVLELITKIAMKAYDGFSDDMFHDLNTFREYKQAMVFPEKGFHY